MCKSAWARCARQGCSAAAILIGFALILCGCPLLGDSGIDKGELGLRRGRKLVVLPFSMPARSYFQSDFGARFSRQVAKLVTAGCRGAVVDVDQLPQSLVQQGAEQIKAGEVIDVPSLVNIGKRLEADYVLVGEIHDVTGRAKKSFGVLQGTLRLSARVVDVAQSKVVWEAENQAFHYPPPVVGATDLPADETDEGTVIRKVMLEAARGVAEPFIGRERSLGESIDRTLH